MRIFRPADLVAMADQVRGGLTEGADQVKELLELVPRVVTLVQRAEFLLDSAERTVARTEAVVARTEAVVARSETLLEGVEEIAPGAMPVLGKVVDAIDPDEVRAFNGIIDRLPMFLEQLEDVGPNVYRILESVTDLSQAIKGFPGMGALIRRGERKDEEEAAEELKQDLTDP